MIIKLILLLFSIVSGNESDRDADRKPGIEEQIIPTSVDSNFLFKDKIMSIFQDSKGIYWLGSREDGLCKYDGKSYTYFTTKDGLPGNSVSNIQEDENGNIWIDNNDVITKFDGSQFIQFDKKDIPSVKIKNESIQLSKNDLWFRSIAKVGEEERGVYRLHGNNLSFLSFENSSLNLTNEHSHFWISSISKVRNNQIWFGTLDQGVIGINNKTLEKIDDENMGYDGENKFIHVRSILLDSKNRLWIGNNGIGILLKEKDSFSNFSEKQGKLIPFQDFVNQDRKSSGLQAVFAIEEDSSGNIWFGETTSGAWKYDGKRLTNYSSIYDSQRKEEIIWDIYNDKNGKLWFILSSGTVFTFNGNSFDKFQGFNK